MKRNTIPITTSILLFLVLQYKEIIIFHDETLVVICFAAFVVLAYFQAKESAAAELNERAEKIKADFETFFALKKESLKVTKQYFNENRAILEKTQALFEFLNTQIKSNGAVKQVNFKNELSNDITNKLKLVVLKEVSTLQNLFLNVSVLFLQNLQQNFDKKAYFDKLIDQQSLMLKKIDTKPSNLKQSTEPGFTLPITK